MTTDEAAEKLIRAKMEFAVRRTESGFEFREFVGVGGETRAIVEASTFVKMVEKVVDGDKS